MRGGGEGGGEGDRVLAGEGGHMGRSSGTQVGLEGLSQVDYNAREDSARITQFIQFYPLFKFKPYLTTLKYIPLRRTSWPMRAATPSPSNWLTSRDAPRTS